jgi:hypothetical protein
MRNYVFKCTKNNPWNDAYLETDMRPHQVEHDTDDAPVFEKEIRGKMCLVQNCPHCGHPDLIMAVK